VGYKISNCVLRYYAFLVGFDVPFITNTDIY
jgi:hypothetical protein